ncbi:restriction endonuclease subunit S [Nonlabens mediterrranea]|uniref:Restriction endonuclease subunit S n=1 Tax=Nonlabens mediterrranea TaxID=1419947 RepID=A0ABS0A3D5_9FLAO|nr:restriction endonuclease subunit S [Nonlabens mediterrranea]
MSELLKPELRFPEFDEDWNETTFDSHYSFKPTNSLSRDKLNYEAGTVKNIHYGDIHTEFDLLFDVTEEKVPFINDDINIDNIDDENYVQKGDLVIADASEDYADIGKAIEVVNTNNECLLAGLHTFLARREDDEVAEGFFAFLLNTYKARYEIMRIAQGTKVLGLSKNRLGEIPLYIPEPEEQQKIANFLKAIDKRIKLLKAKKEALEDYKTSIMQKLFAQEIRFKQENGSDFPEWEEKKISEVANINGGGTPSTSIKEYWNGDINWFTPTEINARYSYGSERKITESGLSHSSATLLPINSILFTSRATVGEVSITKEICSTNQGFQSFIVQKENDVNFIYYWIKVNKKKFLRVATGTTFIEVSKKEIEKLTILRPEYNEQVAIGSFLQRIDERIDVISNAYDNHHSFKQSLLQKMFM